MDKSRTGFSFRKSMRGFNKDDVVQYISEENKRFMQEKTAMEEKLSEAEWHISDMARKIEEQKAYFEYLLKEKDEALNAAKEEAAAAKNSLSEAEAKANEAERKASESEAKATEATAENERLHALVKGCEEQLSQYSERISEFEAAFAAHETDIQECERVKAENEYIREKYKSLEGEFQTLAARARTTDVPSSTLSTPRESHEDPFQRTGTNPSAAKSGYPSKTSNAADNYVPKTAVTTGGSSDKATSGEISDKAITAILAINNDVKKYMTDCVGEFDSYSRDISNGLSKLADDISARCRMLSEKIKLHKNSVSENIDSIYSGFNSDK